MNESIISLVIDAIIDREGGYVDHPADRGGPTKFGITQKTLDYYSGFADKSVKDLTVDDAKAIYRAEYITSPGYHAIADPALFELVVDCAVHSGPVRATKWLQDALRITADGVIGPVTRDNLLHVHASRDKLRAVRARVLASRVRHLGRLITQDSKQSAFAAGWMNRAASFVEGLI
jgi:lysozyme family protein